MIDFEKELNPAQLTAVRHVHGPLLVIAGAGSGKTRTLVFRLAFLASQGVAPESILLLTFTRKAAQEMLFRAERLLGRPLSGTSGGTFHSFAYAVLRRNAAALGHPSGFTLLDRADSEGIFAEAKQTLALGKADRAFPKKSTLAELVTKARNKELPLSRIVESEAFHLASYVDDLEALAVEYERYKRSHALLDYDDLLFGLERLLEENPEVLRALQARHRFVMVDEYQDTNRVQARLVQKLAGESGNVMAVGDDAQSIYAFRGANVANILEFPRTFPGTTLVRLEQNYRSTQPILDLTNAIMAGAVARFDKRLFTTRADGQLPRVVQALSDRTQAQRVVDMVIDLAKRYALHEIAVLFRAGYQSYPIEVALTRVGIGYQKFGGVRFHEAAHVKDALAYLRAAANPADLPAWQRVLGHVPGIGAKTALKVAKALLAGDRASLDRSMARHSGLAALLAEIDALRRTVGSPAAAMRQVLAFYTPMLVELHPDDYPWRQAGLEQLAQIASGYHDLQAFLADLCLDPEQLGEARKDHSLVLSTVHSAKGLEWRAVIVVDLVEGRFPSRKAATQIEDLEEERRLLYVACTRAKDYLALFVPSAVYRRQDGGTEPAEPSRFVTELPAHCFEPVRESYAGGLASLRPTSSAFVETVSPASTRSGPRPDPRKLGFCRHRIFGQGKIVAEVPPNKFRVNFPGFGLKVIVAEYLEML